MNCACLLEQTQRACNYLSEIKKPDCGRAVYEARQCALHIEAMREDYGICARCWMPLQTPWGNRTLPEGYTEVRCRLGETTRDRYAVPTKAVRSLETLLKDQRSRPISDYDLMRARCNNPGYVEWESAESKCTVALYPWKHWHQRPEWAAMIEHSVSDQS